MESVGCKTVDAGSFTEWLVLTDAAYDKEAKSGGLGAVLVDAEGRCRAWLSLKLGCDMCGIFGINDKGIIICELEFLAACLGCLE